MKKHGNKQCRASTDRQGGDEWLTLSEMARRFGVSRQLLWNAISRGRLDTAIKRRPVGMLSVKDVSKYLKSTAKRRGRT